jgi:hypothetical protein
MTSERAKFLLSVYRPNGADAQDPAFKEALDQVRRDPVLADWFRQQRDFDETISAKLRSIEPPAGLQRAVLAGLRATAIPQDRLIRWMAIAAALALALLVLWQMQLSGPGKQGRFMAFYSYALSDFKPLPRLQLMTTNFQRTQEFIKAKGAPTAPTVPAALAGLSTAGCKTLVWEGRPVSLTCFNLPGGQLLHLFVIDRKAFKGQLIPTGFRKIGDWNVKSSESSGIVMMWVSHAQVEEIKQFLL